MPGNKRVVVAMSGGVDSSTALALLKEEGYECIGVSMQLWDYSAKESESGSTSGSCCTLDDINDARKVADGLNVPFYVVNVEEAFSREVVDYFIRDYSEGRTPNPCVKCNQILKFDILMKKALALEADFLATGHYARIIGSDFGPRLLKGVDGNKDQSYFLFTMTRGQLERTLLPLGGMTKAEVRRKARSFGLRTSEKKESQEICFVEEPGYTGFLASRIGNKAGEIVDEDGRVLGGHAGLFNYTIGQRKGLGLSGGPFYVIGMETDRNRLVVGPLDRLDANGLTATGLNWIDPRAREKAADGGLEGVEAKIRYRHPGVASAVRLTGEDRMEVRFSKAQKAVAPGQAVVLYDGDTVLGGGWIEGAIA